MIAFQDLQFKILLINIHLDNQRKNKMIKKESHLVNHIKCKEKQKMRKMRN